MRRDFRIQRVRFLALEIAEQAFCSAFRDHVAQPVHRPNRNAGGDRDCRYHACIAHPAYFKLNLSGLIQRQDPHYSDYRRRPGCSSVTPIVEDAWSSRNNRPNRGSSHGGASIARNAFTDQRRDLNRVRSANVSSARTIARSRTGELAHRRRDALAAAWSFSLASGVSRRSSWRSGRFRWSWHDPSKPLSLQAIRKAIYLHDQSAGSLPSFSEIRIQRNRLPRGFLGNQWTNHNPTIFTHSAYTLKTIAPNKLPKSI